MANIPTFTAVFHPWHCDTMGHVNTRHYAAVFDDASLHMLALISPDRPDLGWADVTCKLTYRREITAGTCVQVVSRVNEIGTRSMSINHTMKSIDAAEVFAEADVKIVRFDKQSRSAVPIEDTIKTKLAPI